MGFRAPAEDRSSQACGHREGETGVGGKGLMGGNRRPGVAAGRGQARAVLPGSRQPPACPWVLLKQLGASRAFPGLCGEVQSSAFGLALTACLCVVKSPSSQDDKAASVYKQPMKSCPRVRVSVRTLLGFHGPRNPVTQGQSLNTECN